MKPSLAVVAAGSVIPHNHHHLIVVIPHKHLLAQLCALIVFANFLKSNPQTCVIPKLVLIVHHMSAATVDMFPAQATPQAPTTIGTSLFSFF